MNIDQLQPGRELDALVAEKVMGHTIIRERRPNGAISLWNDFMLGTPVPNYSTNISDAWEAVEKMTQTHYIAISFHGEGWTCTFIPKENGSTVQSEEKRLSVAVCKASLKAILGGESE